jgi:hypothetical protein
MNEVTSDGQTVWVNGSNGAIGRFGVLGVDIHNEANDDCLDCSHKRTTIEDWHYFVEAMVRIYSIDEKTLRAAMPERLK